MGVESSYYSNLVYNSTGMICFYVALAITALASIILRIINKKYSGIDNDMGVTGYEVASKILSSNGLTDIQIGKVSGTLTDYYNNSNKEIRLSESVYGEKTIAAIAVAAHECGHALNWLYSFSYWFSSIYYRFSICWRSSYVLCNYIPINYFTSRI